MKTPDKKAKDKLKKLKLQARRMWILHDAPPEPEKVPKWEFELFKKIAEEKWVRYFEAKHMNKAWIECTKTIHIDDLTSWNFDHKIPKSRGEEYRLDPANIEIVSVAWHFWKTNWQILKIDYPN